MLILMGITVQQPLDVLGLGLHACQRPLSPRDLDTYVLHTVLIDTARPEE